MVDDLITVEVNQHIIHPFFKVPVACTIDFHYQQIRLSPKIFAEDRNR